MSFSIKLGNFLFRNAYFLYKPMYIAFKERQDKFEIEILKKNIKQGDTIIDIGANIGFYTKILSELVGEKGKVHAFEPDRINYQRLLSYSAGLKNVELNNKAIGPKTEKLKIYTSKMLNVDHRTYKPEEYEEEIEIDAVNLDEYLSGKGKVDIIKMDIQGFEMSAIKGMEQTLKANQNIKLITEFWPHGLKLTGSSGKEYFNYLVNLGFSCYLMENDTLLELNLKKVSELNEMGEKHYYNIFALRK